jgi:hypothetical protein
MGLSLRLFLVSDDNSLQRLPLARYERLIRRDPREYFPQYAGKRVRYALVVVDLIDRKPVGIVHTQYFWLSFDSRGRIDRKAQEKEARLAMEILPPLPLEEDQRSVVNARHLFAKKRYHDDYTWRPAPEIEDAIVVAIFGKSRS